MKRAEQYILVHCWEGPCSINMFTEILGHQRFQLNLGMFLAEFASFCLLELDFIPYSLWDKWNAKKTTATLRTATSTPFWNKRHMRRWCEVLPEVGTSRSVVRNERSWFPCSTCRLSGSVGKSLLHQVENSPDKPPIWTFLNKNSAPKFKNPSNRPRETEISLDFLRFWFPLRLSCFLLTESSGPTH